MQWQTYFIERRHKKKKYFEEHSILYSDILSLFLTPFLRNELKFTHSAVDTRLNSVLHELRYCRESY